MKQKGSVLKQIGLIILLNAKLLLEIWWTELKNGLNKNKN